MIFLPLAPSATDLDGTARPLLDFNWANAELYVDFDSEEPIAQPAKPISAAEIIERIFNPFEARRA